MDITKENFRETLVELDEVIEKAKFFAIDCEFTGISTENNIYPHDRPEHAYRKIFENSSGYILIQLGLTAVRTCDDNPEKFLYKSYNFYVFPRLWKHSFRCQGSSLTFLAENGFNFTKLFREGIPYCNQQEEKQLREKLEEKQKQREELLNCTDRNRDVSNHIPIPEEEKETIERIKNMVEEFLSSETESEKVISDCNGFQRKLIYEMLELEYSGKISASTKTQNNLKVIVLERKKSPEEEESIENERRRNELIELEECIGISMVMQKISNSKKLIVGHNMLLDLVHIIRQCFGPLPDDFKEFKKYTHSIFPHIIDTKYLCTLQKLKPLIKNSTLCQLVETVCEAPFTLVQLEPECEENTYSLNENKAHEAGYDSFLTAKAFLGLVNYLEVVPENISGNSKQLNNFTNKIFLTRLQDICFINLIGNEPSQSRDHVFHVTVPEVWKQADLVQHFKNYGPIFVTWINQSSALISLHNREYSNVVLKTIGSCAGFKVQSLADFEESLEKRLHKNEEHVVPKKRKHNSESASSEEKSVHKHSKKAKKSVQKKKKGKTVNKVFVESGDWS